MSGDITTHKRIDGAIILRVIAGMAIVMLHTMNMSELIWHDSLSVVQERISMSVVYSLMWAVPVFIMVSGALLLDPAKEMSIKKIYHSYVFRVAAALVIFVFAFRIFDLIMNGESFSPAVITDAVYDLISNSSWSHLWYLYLLLGLYILLPAYRMIAAACDEKTFGYLFICCMIFLSIIPSLESTVLPIGFELQIPAIYTLYFFAGYGIISGKLKIPKEWGMLLFVTGFALNLFLMVLSWKLPENGFDSILQSYASPAVIPEALGLFVMIWHRRIPDKAAGVLNIPDAAGFGIYLIHMIPLRFILKYSGLNPYEAGWAAFVFIWAGCYATAVLVTALLRCAPFVRRIL